MTTTRQKDSNGSNSENSQMASSTVNGIDIVNEAKDSAGEVLHQAKEKISEVADQAQNKAKSQLAVRKDQLADGLDSVAVALRRTSEQLHEQDNGNVGVYVTKAATKLSDISNYVRKNDINQLLHEVEGFARREPALMLGSAFALGVIAARFVKSSNQRRYNGELRNTDSRRWEQSGRSPETHDRTNQDYRSRGYGIEDRYSASGLGASDEES